MDLLQQQMKYFLDLEDAYRRLVSGALEGLRVWGLGVYGLWIQGLRPRVSVR